MTSRKIAAFVLCACLLMIGGVFAQDSEPTPTDTPTLAPTDTATNTDTPSPVTTDTATYTATTVPTDTATSTATAPETTPEVTLEPGVEVTSFCMGATTWVQRFTFSNAVGENPEDQGWTLVDGSLVSSGIQSTPSPPYGNYNASVTRLFSVSGDTTLTCIAGLFDSMGRGDFAGRYIGVNGINHGCGGWYPSMPMLTQCHAAIGATSFFAQESTWTDSNLSIIVSIGDNQFRGRLKGVLLAGTGTDPFAAPAPTPTPINGPCGQLI